MRTKRILAVILSVIMVMGLFPGHIFAAVPQNQRPSNPANNMVIGILNDSSVMPDNAFPNEPGITGLTYYYVQFSTGNDGNVNFSLSNNYNGANFSRSAGNYINTNAFWNDERIIRNNSGNAFGYYSPTGLSLDDPFFVTGFDSFFQEESIITTWMQREGISGNASDYKLLFYVIKYESSPWGNNYSGYHLDAKVVKTENVVLSYDANKPAGVTTDMILPNSHSVTPGTDVVIEDLNNRYKNQSANGLNYVFSGWNTKADGSGTDYTDGRSVNVTENIVLYAQWDITNKYEVKWVNYNDVEYATTGHTLSYNDPLPAHPIVDPTRPNDSTHKYTFSHWELIEGNDAANRVTEDLTYKAVYTSETIIHKVIVQVVLNAAFNQDGSLSNTDLIDISTVAPGTEDAIYIKAADGTDYIKLEKSDPSDTGVYVNDAVGNGKYLVYKKEGGDYIQVGTQLLTIEGADSTWYLPYYSVTYDDGYRGEFQKEYYYIGSEVDVITTVPTRDGYVFANWEDEDGVPYAPSTGLKTEDITDSIIKEYELTAQWVEAKKVSVTVEVDHNGRSEDPTADLTVHLTKKDANNNYNEVAGSTHRVSAANWFGDNLTTTTTIYPAGVLYENLDPSAEYAAHAAIAGYRSNTDRPGGAIEVNYDDTTSTYEVTIYLIYDPDGYELEFVVKVDPNIEERFVPKAVDVKVTRWNETESKWEVIPQHKNQSVEVEINGDTRQGSGKVHVWGFNGDTPYLYRIEVVRVDLGSYQIDMGTSADLINYVSEEEGFFPDGAYTADVSVDSHLEGGNLPGAHADKSGETLQHHGSIVATVTAHPYTVSFDPNGGTWEDGSADVKIHADRRFTIPDLADYKPTKEGSTFAGWIKKNPIEAVKASDPIMGYNIPVGGTLELAAVWNDNLTVKGIVVVDLGYPCDDDSRKVRVVLQRREGAGQFDVTAREAEIPITFVLDNKRLATGTYEFTDVPNLDSYHYRVNVVVPGGGTVLYQNEPESTDAANLVDKSKYNENDFVAELNGNLEAVVNIYMEATTFELGYMADTSAIAEGFRPTDLKLDLWHDHQVGEEEKFHQINDTPMTFGTFTGGVSAIKTVSVPPYHASGRLYDYTIAVLSYDLDENVMGADANGWDNRHYYHYDITDGYFPAPFSIHYTGPAEYDATGMEVEGTTYQQNVILKATFEPNTYAINYELNGGHWETGKVGPTHHKWSFETAIPTPVRDGYLFTGWTVTPKDNAQTDIYDETGKKILKKAWTDVIFTANWEKDEWTDGDPDAQDVGDEIPDDEQVRIIYVSANTAFGTVNKELDIVTLPGPVTATAVATPVDANHEFVKWTCEDVTIANPDNVVLNHEITGAVGGKTYVFVAEFKAVDDWHDEEDKDDMPDSKPDVQQVRITYRSGNILGGNVSKGMDIITLEPAPTTSGNITAGAVTATANNGYEFAGWRCDKITFAGATPILNHSFDATGGETYEFVADFTPVDKWNEADDTDTPDGTPDMYQAKFIFESADANMGGVAPNVDIVTIPGAVSHGTVKAEADATANSGYRFVKWTHEGNQVGTVAALDYDFAATGGEEYIFIASFERSGGGGGGGVTRYNLTYETNGGNEIAKESYNSGKVVELTKVPQKDGYIFDGWHLDSALGQDVSEVKMTKHITVYAAWIEDNGSAGSGYDTPGSLNGEDHFAYVVGYPDGTVRPNDKISRAEVTSIFFRLLKPDEVRDKNLTDENDFADVNTADWYNTAISTMAKLGIVNGRTLDSFVPNAFITRAEFAAICARFDESEFEIIDKFTDVKGHWAEHDIHEAAAHGWIRGYEDGTFKPDQLITRAEAMTMINRVLNRVPENADDLLADMINWPDNSDKSAWYYLAVQEATNSHDYEMKNHIYEKWTTLKDATDWTKYE